MKRGIFAAIALLLPASAAAQPRLATVYTNMVDGQRVDYITKVIRATRPAATVPPSITTTEVLPAGWRPPLGPTSYLPPAPRVSRGLWAGDDPATVGAPTQQPGLES